MLQKCQCLFIRICRCYERDLETHDLCNFVKVYLREYYLFSDPESIITPSVKFGTDALEVADPWQSNTDKSFKEFIHSFLAQRDHYTNRHIFPQFEV